jgi:hypothetical protein
MKRFILVSFFLIIHILVGGRQMLASNEVGGIVPPEPNDVVIAPNAVIVPMGRIVLVRKGSEYCAVKFNEFSTGKTEEDRFAKYESYYQGDGTGDLLNENVQSKKGELSAPRPRGIGRLAFSFGNRNVLCGPIKLQWSGKGSIYFYSEGQKQDDYGIQLAPTKWTNISQVNVFDARLKWYGYDAKRPRIVIPVDQLWPGE